MAAATAEAIPITEQDMADDLALCCVAVTYGRFRLYRYALFLAEKIQQAMLKPRARLAIELPPRHGKTTLAVEIGAPWYLKNFPNRRVAYITHTQQLANEKSERARQYFEAIPGGPGLSATSAGKEQWLLEGLAGASEDATGGFTASGIAGGVTGKGFHLLILDDLFKNWEDANSAVIREKVWKLYTSTLRDRLEPDAGIISIQQRWHPDDFHGRLRRSESAEEWEFVCLPALAEEDDPLGRAPGEALSPARYPVEALRSLRRDMTEREFQAKYQQAPPEDTGRHFRREWFRYYTQDGEYYVLADGRRIRASSLSIYQTVDTAGTKGRKSDYFVILTFGVAPVQTAGDKPDILLLDVFREKLETTRHRANLKQAKEKWRPIKQIVERKTFGINVIQQARVDGQPVSSIGADASKTIRAEQAEVFYENGLVHHPTGGAPWLSTYEQELIDFPTGAHDDQVDTIAYACQHVEKYHSGGKDNREEW